MKKNYLLALLPLTIISCGGGSSGPGFTAGMSPKIELVVQNPTLEPNYSSSSKSSTLVIARAKQQSTGKIISDKKPGFSFSYYTNDSVNVHFRCLDGADENCVNKVPKPGELGYTPLGFYTYEELVGGINRIAFINKGTKSGVVKVTATLNDPVNIGNSITKSKNISITSASTLAYRIGTKLVGANHLNSIPFNSEIPMFAYIRGEGTGSAKAPSKNNVLVSIVEAPLGTTISGNYFSDGHSLHKVGQELSLSTDFNGEAAFFVQTNANTGILKLKVITDRSDNNVDNGIQEPVLSYNNYKVVESLNSGTIKFFKEINQFNILEEEVFSVENNSTIVLDFVGDFAAECRVINGSLPQGLFVKSTENACLIEGTTKDVGDHTAIVRVFSVRKNTFDDTTVNFNVKSGIEFTVLPNSNLGSVFVGNSFETEITLNYSGLTSGAGEPESIELISGALPDGIRLVGNLIKGTPNTAGIYTFTLKVTDAKTKESKEKQFILDVIAGSIELKTNGSVSSSSNVELEKTFVNQTISNVNLLITGVNDYIPSKPVAWTLSTGNLPAGVSLNTSSSDLSSTISGTPTAKGTYSFQVSAKDSTGASAIQSFSLKVCIPEVPAIPGDPAATPPVLPVPAVPEDCN